MKPGRMMTGLQVFSDILAPRLRVWQFRMHVRQRDFGGKTDELDDRLSGGRTAFSVLPTFTPTVPASSPSTKLMLIHAVGSSS
jgi:hypothetical protein